MMKIKHAISISKILKDLCLIRQKIKHFCRYCLQCFSSKMVLMKHKKICLEVNGKQNLKLESGTIKFKSYSKEIAVPFKIYADFESLLKGLRINDRDKNPSYTEKYQDHILCSFAYEVVFTEDKFFQTSFSTKEKMQSINLLKQFFKNMSIAKNWWKNILIKILSSL